MANASALGMLLEARGLTKRFPGVVANDEVSLALAAGEVLALLGENGAGKSTLVKMLFGLYEPDEGEICLNGKNVRMRSPRDAISRGVGMVHQHFQLVGNLTVAQNVVLGAEPMRRRLLDRGAARRSVAELSARYQLALDPDALVEDLPVGAQQRVEIVKALYRGARILILDEPTAVLTPQETDELLLVMRQLAQQGTGIIFITHKLREVLAVADRIVVLRGGRVAGTVLPRDTNEAQLAELMVGRSVVLTVEKDLAIPGATVLELRGVAVKDDRGVEALRGVDLVVRSGELVGVAGVEGNGQRELVEAVCGMRPLSAGQLSIGGSDAAALGPRAVHELGVGHIPENREKDGLVGAYSVADNLVLNRAYVAPFARRGIRDRAAVSAEAARLVREYDVRTPGINTTVASLSGGNKQKVVVARELSQGGSLLVVAQPTRGVDVGSIEFIHRQLIAARDRGTAVLLVSAELDEVLALADRVVVLFRGEIVAELPSAEATRERIGLLMAGAQ